MLAPPLRILALDAFHGGSHAAFLDGWQRHSRHEFTLLALPARRWKWRMRHAAVTFADRVAERVAEGQQWDVLLGTDMLNLAEFRGLAPRSVATLPSVVYFHENQLTYPVREERARDLHFGMTNVVSARAADAVWFNSRFHRDAFLDAAVTLLDRVRDVPLGDLVDAIRESSSVQHPGIDLPPPPERNRRPGPLRLLWVSRWEHDKDPETFFAALDLLEAEGVDWRLCVLGESYTEVPECFHEARRRFEQRIDHWGYVESRDDYVRHLATSDVVVSTARHEFFGLAIVEAVAAGCRPLVPRRLAYPEVLGGDDPSCFHDGTPGDLADRLRALAAAPERAPIDLVERLRGRHGWTPTATRMDAAITALAQREKAGFPGGSRP